MCNWVSRKLFKVRSARWRTKSGFAVKHIRMRPANTHFAQPVSWPVKFSQMATLIVFLPDSCAIRRSAMHRQFFYPTIPTNDLAQTHLPRDPETSKSRFPWTSPQNQLPTGSSVCMFCNCSCCSLLVGVHPILGAGSSVTFTFGSRVPVSVARFIAIYKLLFLTTKRR